MDTLKTLTARLGPPLLFLIVGFVLFPSAGRDDSYITFWPAETLASDGVIRNYNGAAVEQSSSLAFVVLIAAVVRATGWPVVIAAWILGIVAGLAVIEACRTLGERVRSGSGPLASWIAAASAGFTYWSFSGAEPALVALSMLAFLIAASCALERGGAPNWFGVLAASTVLVTVRPEGGLTAGCALCGLAALRWWHGRRSSESLDWRSLAALLGLVLAVTLAVVALRTQFFDAAFPQPVSAKSGGLSPRTALEGMRYLVQRPGLLPLLLLASVGILLKLGRTHASGTTSALLTAAFAFAYLSFIVLVGGDWMEGSRFLAHAVPVLAIVAADALMGLGRSRANLLTSALVIVGIGSSIVLSRNQSRALPLWIALELDTEADRDFAWIEHANWAHTRDIPVANALTRIVQTLQERGASDLRLAAENTGFAIYHTVRRCPGIEIVDVHGLTDRTITHGPLHDRVHRAQFGVMWTPERFYAAWSAIDVKTGPVPEVAFFNARTPERIAWLDEHDLLPVYVHDAPNELGASWATGRHPTAAQVIAVQAKLVDEDLRALELSGNHLGDWIR